MKKVCVVGAPTERDLVSAIERQLTMSGWRIVPPPLGPKQTLVLLLTEAALADAQFRNAMEAAEEVDRLVVARLEPVDPKVLPDHIRRINWMHPDSSDVEAMAVAVASTVASDVNEHRLRRRIARDADVWSESGRDTKLLVEDFALAETFTRIIAADRAADEVVTSFVKASVSRAKSVRFRRRVVRIVATLVVVSAVSSLMAAIPAIRANKRVNQAAGALADRASTAQNPSWAALNSVEVLVEGSSETAALARGRALDALNAPWSLSSFGWIDSVWDATPTNNGRELLVLTMRGKARTGVYWLDQTRDKIRTTFEVSGEYQTVATGPDEQLALVGGRGLALIDARSRNAVRLSDEEYSLVRLGRRFGIAARPSEGRLSVLDVRARTLRAAHWPRGRQIIDVGLSADGLPIALVRHHASRTVEIVELLSGRTTHSWAVGGDRPVGALGPNGNRAVFAGDRDTWWLSDGQNARSTGGVVDASINSVTWAGNDRVIVASESTGTTVFQVRGWLQIGKVCNGTPSASVASSIDGNLAVCAELQRIPTVWAVPDTSGFAPVGRPAPVRTVSAGNLTLAKEGDSLVLRRDRKTQLRWNLSPGTEVSALALRPKASQLAYGTSGGEVVVIDTAARKAAYQVISWNAPDLSAVRNVQWTNRGATIDTAAGHRWQIRDSCRGCGTSAGIAAAVRRRMSECFTDRQMSWASKRVRALLQIRRCPEVVSL